MEGSPEGGNHARPRSGTRRRHCRSTGGRTAGIGDLKEGWYLGIVNQDPVLCARQDIWLMKALLEELKL